MNLAGIWHESDRVLSCGYALYQERCGKLNRQTDVFPPQAACGWRATGAAATLPSRRRCAAVTPLPQRISQNMQKRAIRQLKGTFISRNMQKRAIRRLKGALISRNMQIREIATGTNDGDGGRATGRAAESQGGRRKHLRSCVMFFMRGGRRKRLRATLTGAPA